MAIRAEYDYEAGVLYLYLSDQEIARTEDREAEGYAVDLTEDGTAVGIEVLDPSRVPWLDVLAREWGFADRLQEARAAVARALPSNTVASNVVQATTSMVVVGAVGANSPLWTGVGVASQSLSFGDPARQIRQAEPV